MRYHQSACASYKDRETLSEMYDNNGNRLRAMEILSVYFVGFSKISLSFRIHSFPFMRHASLRVALIFFSLCVFNLILFLTKASKTSNGFSFTLVSFTNEAPQAWAIDSISLPFFHSSFGAWCSRWCFLLMPFPNMQFLPFFYFAPYRRKWQSVSRIVYTNWSCCYFGGEKKIHYTHSHSVYAQEEKKANE